MPDFKYAPMFQIGEDKTEYYKVPGSEKLVKTGKYGDKTVLEVSPEALTLVAQQSFHDCQFMLRRAHNEQVAAILSDPEASENDKYVALQFLRNAEAAAKGVLPAASAPMRRIMEITTPGVRLRRRIIMTGRRTNGATEVMTN